MDFLVITNTDSELEVLFGRSIDLITQNSLPTQNKYRHPRAQRVVTDSRWKIANTPQSSIVNEFYSERRISSCVVEKQKKQNQILHQLTSENPIVNIQSLLGKRGGRISQVAFFVATAHKHVWWNTDNI